MARRKRFLIDCDEVLADFQTPVFELLKNYNGRILKPEEYDVWDMFTLFTADEKKAVFAEIEKPGFCESLKPKRGAAIAVDKLRDVVDVLAVTSHFPSSPTWVYERDKWLDHFFAFRGNEIIHTRAKSAVYGEYFLDDNPSHVSAWMAEHPKGVPMLWHMPNTSKLGLADFRVHSWDEVHTRVRSTLESV
jgi:5'(3')-deoxyribonucleotidase